MWCIVLSKMDYFASIFMLKNNRTCHSYHALVCVSSLNQGFNQVEYVGYGPTESYLINITPRLSVVIRQYQRVPCTLFKAARKWCSHYGCREVKVANSADCFIVQSHVPLASGVRNDRRLQTESSHGMANQQHPNS